MKRIIGVVIVFALMFTHGAFAASTLSAPSVGSSWYSRSKILCSWSPIKNAKKYKIEKVTFKSGKPKTSANIKSTKTLNVKYVKYNGKIQSLISANTSAYYISVSAVDKNGKAGKRCFKKISAAREKPSVSLKKYIENNIKKDSVNIDITAYDIPEGNAATVREHVKMASYKNPSNWQYRAKVKGKNPVTLVCANYNGKHGVIKYIKSTHFKDAQSSYDKMKAESVKALAGKKYTGSDYQKAKAIHDYLYNNVSFGGDIFDQTIYGTAINKKAVCAGISCTFKYLCDKNGLDCYVVYKKGDSDHIGHAWNIVKINGVWYMVDVTFDINRKWGWNGQYTYFLVSDQTHIMANSSDEKSKEHLKYYTIKDAIIATDLSNIKISGKNYAIN